MIVEVDADRAEFVVNEQATHELRREIASQRRAWLEQDLR